MKKMAVAVSAVAFLGLAASAQADDRPEWKKVYLGSIGEVKSQHNYNQLQLSVVKEDASYFNMPGNEGSGYEIRGTKTLSNHLYGIGQVSIVDDGGIDSQRFALGLGLNADLGFKRTATDFYTEFMLVNYDTVHKVAGLENSDDGFTMDWRAGVRSNWGLRGVDSRLYVGFADNKAYSGDEDGGMDSVIGASIGYQVVPQVTLSASIEHMDGGEFTLADTGVNFKDSTITKLSIAYNF